MATTASTQPCISPAPTASISKRLQQTLNTKVHLPMLLTVVIIAVIGIVVERRARVEHNVQQRYRLRCAPGNPFYAEYPLSRATSCWIWQTLQSIAVARAPPDPAPPSPHPPVRLLPQTVLRSDERMRRLLSWYSAQCCKQLERRVYWIDACALVARTPLPRQRWWWRRWCPWWPAECGPGAEGAGMAPEYLLALAPGAVRLFNADGAREHAAAVALASDRAGTSHRTLTQAGPDRGFPCVLPSSQPSRASSRSQWALLMLLSALPGLFYAPSLQTPSDTACSCPQRQ